MVKLPQRPRAHVLQNESITFIKQSFPSEWIIESGQIDYGIDLIVEIVKNGDVTGAHFLLQLKGTDSIKILRNEDITYRCKTRTLQYFLERPELVIFLVYSSAEKTGYWIWIQDFIRNTLKGDWINQKTATICIPLKNKLDKKSVEIIERRVLQTHNQNKWLTAIQTAQNPHIGYRVMFDEETVKIAAYSKYPGAVENHPIEINGTFKFDQSAEAQEARKALDNAFKTGKTVRLDSRFFEGFDLAQLAPELFAHLGRLKTKEIEIATAKIDEGFIAKLEILDEKYHAIAEIPYVDLKVFQAGTDEKTLSNEHQPIPLKVMWKFNFVERTSAFNFRLDLEGVNVIEIQQYTKFSLATQNGKWFQITNLANGFSVKERLPEGIVLGMDDEFYSIINDLVFIQQKTKKALQFHGEITRGEWRQMKDLVQILRTGSIQTKAPKYTFSITKDSAIKLIPAFKKSGTMKCQFGSPETNLHFFGANLDLGPRSIILPSATLESETRERLSELDKLPNDAIVDISLDLGDNGIVTSFDNWLPSNSAP